MPAEEPPKRKRAPRKPAASSRAKTPATPKPLEATVEPAEKPAPKAVSKNGVNPNFGMNMPMMSSAFDTAMWLNAA